VGKSVDEKKMLAASQDRVNRKPFVSMSLFRRLIWMERVCSKSLAFFWYQNSITKLCARLMRKYDNNNICVVLINVWLHWSPCDIISCAEIYFSHAEGGIRRNNEFFRRQDCYTWLLAWFIISYAPKFICREQLEQTKYVIITLWHKRLDWI